MPRGYNLFKVACGVCVIIDFSSYCISDIAISLCNVEVNFDVPNPGSNSGGAISLGMEDIP
jgi:hypothetical protein